MKLERQPVPLPGDGSVAVFHHDAANPCPVLWHYHPEYELVYLPKGTGRRQVGRTVSTYEDGELLLLGPNVPHLSYGYGQDAAFEELGVQFAPGFLGPALQASPKSEPVKSREK